MPDMQKKYALGSTVRFQRHRKDSEGWEIVTGTVNGPPKESKPLGELYVPVWIEGNNVYVWERNIINA